MLKEGQYNSRLWAVHSDFLPKCTVRKGKKKSNFTVEKPDKLYLSQVIKVNINSEKSCW